MRKEDFWPKKERDDCRRFLLQELGNWNEQLKTEFKDQAADKKWIREMLMNIFLVARRLVSINQEDVDTYLISEHDGNKSFMEQLVPSLQMMFLTQQRNSAGRLHVNVRNMINGARNFEASPIYTIAEITVGKINSLHQNLMAHAKTMQQIKSQDAGLTTSESIFRMLQGIANVNAKLHDEAFAKTSDFLKGKGGGHVMKDGDMMETINQYYVNRVEVWKLITEIEMELEYADPDMVYGWNEINEIFWSTAPPAPTAKGMSRAYKQKMGGLLGKVTTGMFALCPVPELLEVDINAWFLKVVSIVEDIAAQGALSFVRLISFSFSDK